MYKKICKNIFINGHKQLDMVKDQNCFLTKIKKLKLYIVEFNKDGAIKMKDYLVNCKIRGKKCCLIIIITYNKYIFYANNKI